MITLEEGAEDTVDSSSDMIKEGERDDGEVRERNEGGSGRERERDRWGRVGVIRDLTLDDRRGKRSTHGPTRPVRVMGCMTDGMDEK